MARSFSFGPWKESDVRNTSVVFWTGMKGNPNGGPLFNYGCWLPEAGTTEETNRYAVRPANSYLPHKGRSLRETWSSKAEEFNPKEGGRARCFFAEGNKDNAAVISSVARFVGLC